MHLTAIIIIQTFLTVTCYGVSISWPSRTDRRTNDDGRDITGNSAGRSKRAGTGLPYYSIKFYGSQKALEALQYFVSNATRLSPVYSQIIKFKRPGNVYKATEDYFAVGPTDVKIIRKANEVCGYSGKLSEMAIFLRTCSDPSLAASIDLIPKDNNLKDRKQYQFIYMQ